MKSTLPPNWSWVKLGDVCYTTSGGTPSRGNSKYFNGRIPWVKSGELDKGLILDTEEKISEEALKNSSAKLFPKGTLLIALYGATIGKLAFLGIEAATNQAVCGIYKNENIKSNFLFNFLSFKKQYLVKQSIGGAQPNISQGILKNLEIPLPPPPEQKKIVEKIEELFSGLDDGVSSLKKAKEQIRLYRQSVLASAFSGKLLTPSAGRKAHSEMLKAAEPKTPYSNQLLAGWKWVKNKDLLKYVTSGSRDWKKYYSDSGARFIRTQDINTNRLIFENTAYVKLPEKVEGKRSLVEEGDLLMTITGANVGKVAVVDFPINEAYVSQSVALLKYLDKKITKYLWYYFQAPEFGKTFIEKLVYGMGRPVLSLANMRDVEVLICPYEQQELIISEIEKRFSEVDNLEKAIDDSLAKSETLRQSILKKAFEGKLI